MKRIAILGCENSHADSFLKFIRDNEEFRDVKVVGIYSDESAACEKLHNEFSVPVMSDYADALGNIDGLVITARHGDNHYKYAKPYIKSGIPMFIDKPITVSEDDALSFMRELRENNVRICGGSSLKQDRFVKGLKEDAQKKTNGNTIGGIVRAPYQSENKYGGFYFYAQHLVEMVCEIFGRYPLSVTAKKKEGQLYVYFHYKDYDCTGVFVDENYQYFVCHMAEKDTKSYCISSSNGWYALEFKEFYELLDGGMQQTSYEDFIAPVFIMNAIERSLNSGREEEIRKITL